MSDFTYAEQVSQYEAFEAGYFAAEKSNSKWPLNNPYDKEKQVILRNAYIHGWFCQKTT